MPAVFVALNYINKSDRTKAITYMEMYPSG